MAGAARIVLLWLLAALPGTAAHALQVGSRPTTATQEAEKIVTDPLADTNIRRREIPEPLARISAQPYSLDGIKTCSQIGAAVTELDGVLGPDVDAPPPSDDKTRDAVAVTREVVGSLVPFRGLVREISGANKAEQAYEGAVYAGLARRAYLKGVGTARGCKPPAAALAGS